MNKKELSAKLIKAKVPKDTYSLDGGLPNEMYCLDYLIGKKNGKCTIVSEVWKQDWKNLKVKMKLVTTFMIR